MANHVSGKEPVSKILKNSFNAVRRQSDLETHKTFQQSFNQRRYVDDQ